MFPKIRIQPFNVDEVEIDVLNPPGGYLQLANILLLCKTDENATIGTHLVTELQYTWLDFLVGLYGPISGLPLYIDRLKFPFSSILYLKFATAELKTHNIKNGLQADQPLNNDPAFWENLLLLLNVIDSYPQYIKDLALDYMEQAIYDHTIPFNHLTDIAKIYSHHTLDTRLVQRYINEEKTVEILLNSDSFEIEKLILPSDYLVKQMLNNPLLYSKIIRLWSLLPNEKGIFDFELTTLFLVEFDVADKTEQDWCRLIYLCDLCRYLSNKNHFYLLFHVFLYSADWTGKLNGLPKIKDFVLSIVVELIEQEHVNTLISTYLDPSINPLNKYNKGTNITSPHLFTAFEYILPYMMPGISLIPNLLDILVKKQLALVDTLKAIKTVLIHLAAEYHQESLKSNFALFQHTQLMLLLFTFKHTPRNESYYEVLRIYLSLILTCENESDIDHFYMDVCSAFINIDKGLGNVKSFELDASVLLLIMSNVLSDNPPLHIQSIETTWQIVGANFNLADDYFNLYISFIKYLLATNRVSDFQSWLTPLLSIDLTFKTDRIIASCHLLTLLVTTAPNTIEHQLSLLENTNHFILLLNHPIADVYWSAVQVLLKVCVEHSWVSIEAFKEVSDQYWSNILYFLIKKEFINNAANLKKLEYKTYLKLLEQVMSDQLPEPKTIPFQVMLNVNKFVHPLFHLPKLTSESGTEDLTIYRQLLGTVIPAVLPLMDNSHLDLADAEIELKFDEEFEPILQGEEFQKMQF